MTDSLLLHPKTRKQAESVVSKPPQALLIYGPIGSGKRALAEHITAQLLGIPVKELANHPYYLVLQKPDNKQEISIDAVRSVIAKLNLKTVIATKNQIKRVVLIDDAHLSSAEAQNALLKVIEEPPGDTIFILTSISDSAVLPTIASRTERLAVTPSSLEDATRFFKEKFSPTAVYSAWNLSGGAPGLLNAILQDDDNHPLKQSVETAKRFLSLGKYDRLLFIDNLSADKAEFLLLLDALSRILAALHHAAVRAGNTSQIKRLAMARKLVNSTADSLAKNTSGRLLAMNLALKLPI